MAGRAHGAYFSIVSALLLFLSVAAFSDNLFTNIHQPSNSDPKFIVHGLFGLTWYVLLVVQSNLIRVRNIRLHRRLGIAAFVVAIGLTVSTLYLFIVLWKGWGQMAPEVRANRLLLPGFATFLSLAWLKRGQPDWHKRLIFSGTFLMQAPVLSRAYDPLLMSWMEPLFPAATERLGEAGFIVYYFGTWIGLFLSLAVHDWRMMRRVHPVTLAGFSWFVIAWLVSLVT